MLEQGNVMELTNEEANGCKAMRVSIFDKLTLTL